MDRMKHPEPRIVLMSVALLGIGSMAGILLERLSLPHVARFFNTCASSKQFIVEFRKEGRYWQAYPPGAGTAVLVSGPTLDVDGVLIGHLSDGEALRHFFCEGNHSAHVRYSVSDGKMETHTIDFAVSRPSLFHVWQAGSNESDPIDCRSDDPCTSTVGFRLSPYEPDDPEVRVLPPESSR